ncbi:MAG: 50S ribosomal protein L3 [Omnitrophica bacterium RBG_13_46_9]|nr:MAG: 50S ribosomal protein L3 [Omnitrophica bacterium RBG_13_46_9]
MAGIIGKKVGMTNIFNREGHVVPVTVIEAGPCVVLGTKTNEKDGYFSVLLGFGDIKMSKVKKPQLKMFEKLNIPPKKVIKEIRTLNPSSYNIGDKVDVKIFKIGDYVDVSGVSIGKGFQGGIKRWHWRGGESGHGSMFHRAPGSIGASSFPSRVFKGHHLPGHMGNVKRTIQNLEVMAVDEEKNLLIVKGGVPGHKSGILIVRNAKKIPATATIEQKNEDKK